MQDECLDKFQHIKLNCKTGVNIMKELKVFIASSNELQKERVSLQKFINEESNQYHDYGLHIKPEMWELESRSFNKDVKQKEYIDKLLNSNIVIFMFGSKVGKHTKEEFEEACNSKRERGNPEYIFAFFKNVDMNSSDLTNERIKEIDEVLALKKEIEENLRQVYNDFYSEDDLQLKVSRELSKITLPIIAISNNEGIYVDNKIKELVNLYNGISQAFQVSFKDIIISSAINQLFLLQKFNIQPKRSQLSEKDFYMLCQSIMDNTQEGSYIKALSMMLKCEWTNSKEEINFWQANLDAVKRKVLLERIFIVKKDEAHRLKNIPQIMNHEKNKSHYLKPYVVEKEYLSENYPNLLERAGNGFLLINDKINKIALLDNAPDGEMRGTPIFDAKELKDLESTFDSIKKVAVSLEDYLKTINLSHHKKEMLSVFVTTECNLNCDYCFTNKHEDGHRNQTVDLEFVKKGIDDYFETDYLRHIRFFGAGEPTVKLDLIKAIHKYAKEKGGDCVTFEIQTNGAFNGSTANWLAKNIDIIWISCDGTPDMQDLHRKCLDTRKKSSELIERNIRILRSGNNFVGIRATITNENVDRQKEMIDYFCQLGIKHIWVDPIFPSVGEDTSNNSFDYMHFAEQFLEAVNYAEQKDIFYGSIMTCNFSDTVNKHCRACIPVPHLTTDGYVSACDMALFGEDKNHMSPFIYGKWDPLLKKIIYNDEKIRNLQSRTTENMHHCDACPSKEHCGGYCLGEVLNETKDLFGCKKGVCEAIVYLDKKMGESQRKYHYTHP